MLNTKRVVAIIGGDYRSAIRYLIAGFTAFAVDFLGYLLLIKTGMVPSLAAVASYCIGFVISFTLTKLWVFKSKSRSGMMRELKYYSLLAGFNLILSWLVVEALVDAGVHKILAKLIIMSIIVIYNFVILRLIFNQRESV